MVKFIFLFFIGMDWIAILVDLLKVGRLPLISICLQGVSVEMNILNDHIYTDHTVTY